MKSFLLPGHSVPNKSSRKNVSFIKITNRYILHKAQPSLQGSKPSQGTWLQAVWLAWGRLCEHLLWASCSPELLPMSLGIPGGKGQGLLLTLIKVKLWPRVGLGTAASRALWTCLHARAWVAKRMRELCSRNFLTILVCGFHFLLLYFLCQHLLKNHFGPWTSGEDALGLLCLWVAQTSFRVYVRRQQHGHSCLQLAEIHHLIQQIRKWWACGCVLSWWLQEHCFHKKSGLKFYFTKENPEHSESKSKAQHLPLGEHEGVSSSWSTA